MPDPNTSDLTGDNLVSQTAPHVWPPPIGGTDSGNTARLEGVELVVDEDTLTIDLIPDRRAYAIQYPIFAIFVGPLIFHSTFVRIHPALTLLVHGSPLPHVVAVTLIRELIMVYAAFAVIGLMGYVMVSGCCWKKLNRQTRQCVSGSGVKFRIDRIESVGLVRPNRSRPSTRRVYFRIHGDSGNDISKSGFWPRYLGTYHDPANAALTAKIVADFVGVPVK